MDEAVIRDVRVDRIGAMNALVKHIKEPALEAVKQALEAKGARAAAGDGYRGLLVAGTTRQVNPRRWLGLYNAGKITLNQFLSALSIRTARAREVLSEKDLERISEEEPTAPQLRVSAIPDAQLDVAAALTALGEELGRRLSAPGAAR